MRRGDERPRRRLSAGVLNPFDQSRRERIRRQIQAERERPYGYESNRRMARAIAVALGIWVALALTAAWTDNQMSEVLARWQKKGYTSAPSSSPYPEELVAFAQANGVACNSVEEIVRRTEACDEALKFHGEFNSAQDVSSSVFALLLLTLVVLAFMFGVFTHRASRNLLPLKSEGQKFSPVASAVWLYVPVINLLKGMQIFTEIWRASSPNVDPGNPRAWKSTPRSALVSMWWLSVALAVTFSPPVMARLASRATIAEHINSTRWLVYSDLLMIIPAILATVAILAIDNRQEARYRVVGPNMVKPIIKEPEF